MRIYIGSDHAGFEYKSEIIQYLQTTDHEVIDIGAHHYDPQDDYPAYCIETARLTVADPKSLGIVLGGSGNGEQIAANKVPFARCALVWNQATAQLAREHNNAQLMSIGARMHDLIEVLNMVEAFVNTPFSEEKRHIRRIEILDEYQTTGNPPQIPETT